MIPGLFDRGALPALERLVQFTGARHRVLAGNIANLSTPYFKPVDLDPRSFQAALGEAIDRRREVGRAGAALEIKDTDQLTFSAGATSARPQVTNDNVLFHDQNNRDLERLMQRLAENTLTHNAAIELIRNQFAVMQTAIRQRV